MLFSHKTGSTGTCCRADGLSEGSQTARCRASGSSDPECQEGADLWGKRAQRWPGAEGREAQGAHLRVSVSFQGEDVPELDRCVGCMTVKVQIPLDWTLSVVNFRLCEFYFSRRTNK